MQPSEFSAVHPRDYLKDGPLDEDGALREGLNGQLSLAMAYRLRAEGVGPARLKVLVDRVKAIGEAHMPKTGAGSVPERARKELAAIWPGHETGALLELKEALSGWLTGEWRHFAAVALHLERIMKQLALISLPPPG